MATLTGTGLAFGCGFAGAAFFIGLATGLAALTGAGLAFGCGFAGTVFFTGLATDLAAFATFLGAIFFVAMTLSFFRYCYF